MGNEPIRIAIAGGGIAGLTLARGLARNQNLHVTVYESAKEYLDIGGGLAFHGNAIRALELIDPALKDEYFARATLMQDREVELATEVLVGDEVAADGSDIVLAELGKAKGRKTVARYDLLKGLLSLVHDRVVFGKRLTEITERAEEIELKFKDGTSASADVLLSCDGVHSYTRTYLLGRDHPAAQVVNHDRWTRVERVVPLEEANALNDKLGGRVPILCGNGAYVNSIPIRFGQTLSITVISMGATTATTPNLPATTASGEQSPEFLRERFKHWANKEARDYVELVARSPTSDWPIADHDPAPFYARGRICLVGDAAHACMPFNGQGAAQAIEDSAVLVALFERVESVGQVEAALRAYDAVRRPRSQRVCEISRQFGRLYVFDPAEGGRDVDQIRKRMMEGGMYSNNVDLEAQNEDALARFASPV